MIDYREPEDLHPTTASERAAPGCFGRGRQVVGVLPFINVSNDPRLDNLSSGITRDVMEVLTNSSGLDLELRRCTLFPSSTNVHLGHVGCCLDVQLLLLGSVRIVEKGLVVTAQLICVTSCRPIWTFRCHNDIESERSVTEQMAAEIASQMAGPN